MTLELSEREGILAMRATDRKVYSVGISTFGDAELAMLKANSERTVIATTIDKAGFQATIEKMRSHPVAHRLTVKYEDVREPLPYPDRTFDFIYARLVLHHLDKKTFERVLFELKRVLKVGGRLYCVVRSSKEWELQQPGVYYHQDTDMTTYPQIHLDGTWNLVTRRFYSPATLSQAFTRSGFSVLWSKEFDETLYKDFTRTAPMHRPNKLVSLLAERRD